MCLRIGWLLDRKTYWKIKGWEVAFFVGERDDSKGRKGGQVGGFGVFRQFVVVVGRQGFEGVEQIYSQEGTGERLVRRRRSQDGSGWGILLLWFRVFIFLKRVGGFIVLCVFVSKFIRLLGNGFARFWSIYYVCQLKMC